MTATAPGELAAAVRTLLAAQGPLGRDDPNYRERAEQLDMAQAVAQAIESQDTLVVEAGTGVGKTYAYLVPLLLSGRRGIVSTATKGLQDQLFHRDLPRLCNQLGVPITTALLKGRSAYLCRHRMQQARLLPQGLERGALRTLARVEDWARSTVRGDLSEVAGLDERSSLLPLITSTRENCLGSECPSHGQCHVMQARREAMAADLVVVNHHLFFADLALKEGGMAELLPAAEVVVFDEAHQILETGLQFMATQLGTLALIDLAGDLRAAGLQHARGQQDWVACAHALEQAARELALACAAGAENSQRRVRWTVLASGRPDAQARPVEVGFAQALQAAGDALQQVHEAALASAEAHPDFARLAQRATEAGQRVQMMQGPVGSDRVRWVDLAGSSARLIDTPLDVRDTLQQTLSQTRRAWVFTSATLGGEPTLQWFRQRCGLDGEAVRVLTVGSPYDYAQHARMWVPQNLPEPGQPQHSQAVAQLAARCAARLGGRTFVLATTLRALPVIAQEMTALFAQRGLEIEVLVQGSEPKGSLLQRFLQAGQGSIGRGAVLVGSASFWEGIDVPGRALQCVVIDKLPFPPPDDPLLEARTRALKSQGRDPFEELFLAETAIALKQGAGRLIRSETDQGLLVLCDTRLRSKRYGTQLLAALPPMPQAADGAEVVAWLDALRAQAAA